MRIDLHTHSDASDGTTSPADVVRRAAESGLSVVALTDHDTVAGCAAAAAALPSGLTLVTGAEISCGVDVDGRRISLHLLGYLFDPDEPAFAAERERLRDDRLRRAEAIVGRLNHLGADVRWQRVREIAGEGAVGRPHIARAMVEAGVVEAVGDAFGPDWIGDGGRAYVEKYTLDAVHAIRLICGAGGVAVFAHPKAAKRGPVVSDQVVADLAAAGLAALEADHPDHPPGTRERVRALAAELGLPVTGASDDHGATTAYRLGCETTDPEVYAALVAQATGAEPIAA